MPRTAGALIHELATRLGGWVSSTPTTLGTQTTLIDTRLRQYLPVDIPNQLNWWVLGGPTTGLNAGRERRARSWTYSSSTITLYDPGFDVAIAGGTYELYPRFPRSRLIEFLNEAVGQLALTWYRATVEETLTTADQTWRYQLNASSEWSQISRVEIQINTDTNLVGYPFADADYLNWRARRQVDQSGNETWLLEFGMLPPPGRILRVWGEGFYPDLYADTDVLALAGAWERPAMAWIYKYAQFLANDELSNRQPTGDGDKARQRALDQLERQKNDVLMLAPSHRPGKIIVPGMGDADAIPSPGDRAYLGAFRSAAMIPGGG